MFLFFPLLKKLQSVQLLAILPVLNHHLYMEYFFVESDTDRILSFSEGGVEARAAAYKDMMNSDAEKALAAANNYRDRILVLLESFATEVVTRFAPSNETRLKIDGTEDAINDYLALAATSEAVRTGSTSPTAYFLALDKEITEGRGYGWHIKALTRLRDSLNGEAQ